MQRSEKEQVVADLVERRDVHVVSRPGDESDVDAVRADPEQDRVIGRLEQLDGHPGMLGVEAGQSR